MGLPKLSEQEKHEKNPFMLELQGKMYLQPRANYLVGKDKKVLDMATGEIEENLLIGSRKIVDKSQFAKIYASEIGILFDLTKTAINVFMYLSKIMDYDNRAYFNYNREYKKVGYKSHVPCLKGLRELVKHNIIACDIRENHFWLNPALICKGERFTKFIQYEVSKGERNELDIAKAELKKGNIEFYETANAKTGGKLEAMNGQKQSNLFDNSNEHISPFKEK
jgi:hypothetical protein